MASACAGTGTGNTTSAVDVMYNRGDAVWYRQRDGSEVPAKVGQPFLRLTKLLFLLVYCRLCIAFDLVDHAIQCSASLSTMHPVILTSVCLEAQTLHCVLGCGR